MIRHCVFINFKSSVSVEHRDTLFNEIAALQSRLAGIKTVHIGRNVSPETGMDKGYAMGSCSTFREQRHAMPILPMQSTSELAPDWFKQRKEG